MNLILLLLSAGLVSRVECTVLWTRYDQCTITANAWAQSPIGGLCTNMQLEQCYCIPNTVCYKFTYPQEGGMYFWNFYDATGCNGLINNAYRFLKNEFYNLVGGKHCTAQYSTWNRNAGVWNTWLFYCLKFDKACGGGGGNCQTCLTNTLKDSMNTCGNDAKDAIKEEMKPFFFLLDLQGAMDAAVSSASGSVSGSCEDCGQLVLDGLEGHDCSECNLNSPMGEVNVIEIYLGEAEYTAASLCASLKTVGKCGTAPGGQVFKTGKNADSTCAGATCTKEECFKDEAVGICGTAPGGQVFKTGKNAGSTCAGATCTKEECFEDEAGGGGQTVGKCGTAPGGQVFKPEKNAESTCAGATCTKEECFKDEAGEFGLGDLVPGHACEGETVGNKYFDINSCIQACKAKEECNCVTWMYIPGANECKLETGSKHYDIGSSEYSAITMAELGNTAGGTTTDDDPADDTFLSPECVTCQEEYMAHDDPCNAAEMDKPEVSAKCVHCPDPCANTAGSSARPSMLVLGVFSFLAVLLALRW